MKPFLPLVTLSVVALASSPSRGAENPPRLPQGPGLAARYPGDAGIEHDPQVLLHEDFEAGEVKDLAKRWESVSNEGGQVLAFSDTVPTSSVGKRSLQTTATLGANTGGHLYRRLPREVDRAFARFYVKFAAENDYTHHFVHFGGYHPSTAWPQGGAGERPRGDERITVGIEPFGDYGKFPSPGAWFFYAYWHEMKGSADGKFWGNGLRPAEPQQIPKETWQCVEIMVQLNSAPDKHDGELALWIDGKPVAHFAPGARRGLWSGMGFTLRQDGGEPVEGFNFRTSTDLKINFFWLLHYVTENAARQNHVTKPNPINRVWFDDIVVATSYIGPVQAKAKGSRDGVSHLDAKPKTVRIAAAQPKARLINWRLREPGEVVAKVDQSLRELRGIIDQAGAEKCDAIAFPEDTLGLGTWLAANENLAGRVLPPAVETMLREFGKAAAQHRMYVVCCNDTAEANGAIYNTAFLIGRDGAEIGRYHKVLPVIHERFKKAGMEFPVFNTPDLGGVGMLICYDMVFPEAARCLALGGADIIFYPTLGGAAIGDDEICLAALRTRAVENFVYLVTAQRGSGAMIVSPQGKVIARAKGSDSLAIAEIDPFGDRVGGDAMNEQQDMRARLFRERSPAAFTLLTATNPPVLQKVPATISESEAVRIAAKTLTLGEEEFKAAQTLLREGQTNAAIKAFERLRWDYPQTWIDRVAGERLEKLRP